MSATFANASASPLPSVKMVADQAVFAEDAAPEGRLTLVSSDEKSCVVRKAAAFLSGTIRNVAEYADGENAAIPIPAVTGDILGRIVVYCEHHADHPAVKRGDDDTKRIEVEKWDADFVAKIDLRTLFEVILAANFLDIQCLLDLTCLAVADMIKGKTSAEVRSLFGIKNDFTVEEENQVRKECAWCDET